jgi:hypothetical protein
MTRARFLALQIVPLVLAAGARGRGGDHLRAGPQPSLTARRRVDAQRKCSALRATATRLPSAAARRGTGAWRDRRAPPSSALAELEHLVADAKLRDEVRDRRTRRRDRVLRRAAAGGHLNAWRGASRRAAGARRRGAAGAARATARAPARTPRRCSHFLTSFLCGGAAPAP